MTSSLAETLKKKEKERKPQMVREEDKDFPSGCSLADKQCCGPPNMSTSCPPMQKIIDCQKCFFFFSLSLSSFAHKCRHAQPFSVKWGPHNPNSFEFKYESCSHEVNAAKKSFSQTWQPKGIRVKSEEKNQVEFIPQVSNFSIM